MTDLKVSSIGQTDIVVLPEMFTAIHADNLRGNLRINLRHLRLRKIMTDLKVSIIGQTDIVVLPEMFTAIHEDNLRKSAI